MSMMDLPPDIERYRHLHMLRSGHAYIVWRRGTGDNVEITHIRGNKKGEAYKLFRKFLRALEADPPYGGNGTVFGFTREGNLDGLTFYDRAGFSISRVQGVYAEGTAVCFSALYKVLVNIHLRGINEDHG